MHHASKKNKKHNATTDKSKLSATIAKRRSCRLTMPELKKVYHYLKALIACVLSHALVAQFS